MQARLVIHGDSNRLRSSISFSMSACLHALVLAWLALYATILPDSPGRSIYEQEIRPYEKHLVWYNRSLPNVGRAATSDRRPLRAREKFRQEVVAGNQDLPSPPQLIRMPAPRIELPKMLELPNLLAVAPPPRPVKSFTAPPSQSRPAPATALPDAPQVALATPKQAMPFEAAAPRPHARAFAPLPRADHTPALAVELPAAPELRGETPTFAAPSIPRGFEAPPARVEAPRTPAADTPPDLAIVGLNPVTPRELKIPPGSHDAGFSAGPEVRTDGASEAPAENAVANMPGLVMRGGSKEPPGSLMSVFAPLARRAIPMDVPSGTRPGTPPPPAGPRAAHVSSAPDSLKGRYVYTVAIQMPNVTSYSGSWIVWFADRDPATGSIPADMRAPDPVRKVDPKYIQTAVEEGVQGVVRLSAVIRRDGRVERVELLRHLDDRLDRSAQEALAKWQFEPARRDGVPVEVDAVFEIPFRLAPKSER